MQDIFLVLLIFCGFLIGNAMPTCDCLDRIILLHNNGDFRLISSPNYPFPYCSILDCHWHIVAPSNSSKVRFNADNLDLRRGRDEILFYDFKASHLLLNKTASHKCTDDELCYYTSKFQYLTIRFRAQGEKTENVDNFGFQAVVSVQDPFSSSNSTKSQCGVDFIPIFIIFSLFLFIILKFW